MTKINMLGLLDMKGNECVRRVYGIDGLSPTLTTSQGGHRQPKILVGGDEMKAFAMRGRYNEDGTTSQQVEFRKDDVTSTLTGVQKDNMLLEWGRGELIKLKTNDLFCGAGGMGLGFKNAGFEIAGAWDFDKFAVQTYKHNVGDHVMQADISRMTYKDMPKADVWTFGFPCQDLSIAGKQAGLFEGKRSGLFFEVMRLLDETIESDVQNLPSIIMAENVKGLKPYLEVLKTEYAERGYNMYHVIYNSKYWGVPQNRERYFVIGVHESIEKEFVFPEQQEIYIPRLSTVLDDVVEDKYYIDPEKGAKIIEQAMDKLRVREATKKGYAEAVEGDTINLSHPNSKTRRGRVGKQVAQTLLTGQEQVYVEKIQSVFTDKTGVAFCADASYAKGISPGDVGNGRRTHIVEGGSANGYRVRKLTPREYLRLQGFPDSFEQVVSDSQQYKQAGNAVTVNVAQAIAERIKMFLLSL